MPVGPAIGFNYIRTAKTSVERRWSTSYSRPLCEFGETLLFRVSKYANHKAESAWDYSIWLGKCTRSDEHFAGTATGIYRTRTVRRLPLTDRYNKELRLRITATPWETNGIGTVPTPSFVLPTLPEDAQQNYTT